MADSLREDKRRTFDDVAETYSNARPEYPEEIIDDVVSLAGLRAGSRIVEIGPGTGQATRRLAERGLTVTGVEFGGNLARVARQKLACFSNVEIVTSAFETWQAPRQDYDAIASFTAFHWIDPAVKYPKSAELLNDGGRLVVVNTKHVFAEGDEPFWLEVQQDYDALFPDEQNVPPPPPDQVPDLSAEIEASGYFRSETARRYLLRTTYTPESYIALLETFSGHRKMSPEKRGALYKRIRRRINQHPSQRVTKTLLATLNVALKR